MVVGIIIFLLFDQKLFQHLKEMAEQNVEIQNILLHTHNTLTFTVNFKFSRTLGRAANPLTESPAEHNLTPKKGVFCMTLSSIRW